MRDTGYARRDAGDTRYSVMPDPPLDPLAASFGRVADAYDLGRPSYPPEALAWLCPSSG